MKKEKEEENRRWFGQMEDREVMVLKEMYSPHSIKYYFDNISIIITETIFLLF